MIEKINTALLLILLVAVTWLGIRLKVETPVGRYVPIDTSVLDTATGKVYTIVDRPSGSLGPVSFDMVEGAVTLDEAVQVGSKP